MFYCYPAEVIAEWCAVSLATAREYKLGRRKPPPPVARLFELHRDRRVLGPTWNGWLVKPDSIVDPDGNETGRMQLYNYFWVVQFARQLAAERSQVAHAQFYALLSGDVAPPPAEVREAIADLLEAR